jgi:hypothetical protein
MHGGLVMRVKERDSENQEVDERLMNVFFFSILKSLLRKVCNEVLKKVNAAEILCRFAGCFIYLSQSLG